MGLLRGSALTLRPGKSTLVSRSKLSERHQATNSSSSGSYRPSRERRGVLYAIDDDERLLLLDPLAPPREIDEAPPLD